MLQPPTLLLPERHFRFDIGMADSGCDGVRQLADYYEASIVATALRFTRFAELPTVLVMLEPGAPQESGGTSRSAVQAQSELQLFQWQFSYTFRGTSQPIKKVRSFVRWLVSQVEELSSLADLGLGDERPLHLSARLLPYRDAHGISRATRYGHLLSGGS